MPTEIYLVKVGMTMTEGVVAEWHIPDGGQVESGQLLYALETEKITLEVDAEATGTVRHLVATGISCDPGQVVGYIYGPDEAIPAILPAPGELPADTNPVDQAAPPGNNHEAPASAPVHAVLASPIAKKMARKAGLSLQGLVGSGPGGRIVEADVAAALASPQADSGKPAPPSSPSARRLARERDVALENVKATGPRGVALKEDVEAALTQPATPGATAETIPLNGMRRTIARRMHESLQNSAQLTMDMEVVMDEAVKLRSQLIEEWQAQQVRPTITDLVLRAVVKALPAHPLLNSQMSENEILLHREIHLGLAVALDDGLLVPVIRNAHELDLLGLCRESSRLATAAKAGSLSMDEMQGGTFTVSAMGMFGVDSFTPILNSPQAGILGVNRLYDGVGWVNDQAVHKKLMKLSLTWDHRILDGAPAAKFLQAVCQLLEAPYRLMV